MKNSIFLTVIMLFFLASCGGSSKNTGSEDTATNEQVEILDSLSKEMDDVSSEIDKNAKALDEALSELENE